MRLPIFVCVCERQWPIGFSGWSGRQDCWPGRIRWIRHLEREKYLFRVLESSFDGFDIAHWMVFTVFIHEGRKRRKIIKVILLIYCQEWKK